MSRATTSDLAQSLVSFQLNILMLARQLVMLSKASTVSFDALRLLRMAVEAASKHGTGFLF